MKKILLVFFAAMTIIPGRLSAQVTEFDIGSVTNSIVRSVNDSTQLIYIEVSPTESYFVLYHDGDSYAKAFRFPQSGRVHVHDMRIKDMKAYFCGSINQGVIPDGLMGMFTITDFMGGSCHLSFVYFGQSSAGDIYVNNLQRMEFPCSGNPDGFAMVGDATYLGKSIKTVVTLYQDATDVLTFCALDPIGIEEVNVDRSNADLQQTPFYGHPEGESAFLPIFTIGANIVCKITNVD